MKKRDKNEWVTVASELTGSSRRFYHVLTNGRIRHLILQLFLQRFLPSKLFTYPFSTQDFGLCMLNNSGYVCFEGYR